MLRRASWAVAVVCLLLPIGAYAQNGYLEVFVDRVKPDKNADFVAIAKKFVDANRRNNGETWLGLETVFGESDTYDFVVSRGDYAALDKAHGVFEGAVNKAYGKEGAEKLFHDLDSCLISSRTELRMRRMDLSRKAPADAAALAKMIGESRVLRTTVVHVRPGRGTDFENLLKDVKAASEQNPNTHPLLVSQVVEGGKGATFYITSLRSSMGGFDNNPTMHEILGDEGYKKFQQTIAEIVETTGYTLMRFSPEISNPPSDVVAVAPDFWQPKAPTTASKTNPGAMKASTEKPTQ
jgi:hypothetical protein